jgi:hypothetical protein
MSCSCESELVTIWGTRLRLLSYMWKIADHANWRCRFEWIRGYDVIVANGANLKLHAICQHEPHPKKSRIV